MLINIIFRNNIHSEISVKIVLYPDHKCISYQMNIGLLMLLNIVIETI